MSHLSERPVYIVDNSDHFLESLPVVPKEELERCEKLAKSMWVENIKKKIMGIRKIVNHRASATLSWCPLFMENTQKLIFIPNVISNLRTVDITPKSTIFKNSLQKVHSPQSINP